MLRITVVESSGSVVRLRVEGRLSGRSVEELRQSCELHASADGAKLVLDLGDVSFADEEGAKLLRSLRMSQVGMANLGPFLTSQLRESSTVISRPAKKGDRSSEKTP